jgi:hypothetical protein
MVSARRVAVAITSVAGRAVLGAAAVMLASCGGQHMQAPATTSPAASSPSTHSSSTAAAVTGSVHFPAQLLGLKKNTTATGGQVASTLSRVFASRLVGQVVAEKAAIYGGQQNASPPFFLVVAGAWAKRVASPEAVAHIIQEFLVTRGFTDARVLPTGANGEVPVCGHKPLKIGGADIVCEWADHATFGVVLYPPGFASSLSDGASKTSQIRSAVVG